MTAQTGGSRTAALHMGFRQSWYHLINQRCGLDIRKCPSVGPPAREELGQNQDCCHPIDYMAPRWRVHYSNSARYLYTLGMTEATPNALKYNIAQVCL